MQKSFIKSRSFGLYVLILLNLLFIPFYSTKALDHEEGIIPALNSLQLTIEEININAHVSMYDRFIQAKEAAAICREIGNKFDVKDYVLEDLSTWDDTQVILKGIGKEAYDITIIIQAAEIPEITETNIVVDILSKVSTFDMSAVEDQVREILGSYGKIDFTSCITAVKPAKLSFNRQKEIVNQLMEILEAKEVEYFSDGSMISVTGYSKNIEGWTQYSGNKVNLNIAVRYNSYENKTYLWLGTPFITIGY